MTPSVVRLPYVHYRGPGQRQLLASTAEAIDDVQLHPSVRAIRSTISPSTGSLGFESSIPRCTGGPVAPRHGRSGSERPLRLSRTLGLFLRLVGRRHRRLPIDDVMHVDDRTGQ